MIPREPQTSLQRHSELKQSTPKEVPWMQNAQIHQIFISMSGISIRPWRNLPSSSAPEHNIGTSSTIFCFPHRDSFFLDSLSEHAHSLVTTVGLGVSKGGIRVMNASTNRLIGKTVSALALEAYKPWHFTGLSGTVFFSPLR